MTQIINIRLGKYNFKMSYDETNQCDIDLGVCLRRFGSPEPEVVYAMDKIVRAGDTVIDGGANIGFFTLLLAQMVGTTGRVVAVEPGKNNILKLASNIALNGLDNVTVVRLPLWGTNGKLHFYLTRHGGHNSIGKCDAYESTELDTVRLDDLTDEPPRLIKLDIEGAETNALQALPGGTPFIITEMNQKALAQLGSSQRLLRGLMQSRGYDMFLLDRKGAIPTLVPRNTEIVTVLEALNVLFSTTEHVGLAWDRLEIIAE